jgi:hypothetical protein
LRAIILLLACLACAKAPARPEPAEPTDAIRSLYSFGVTRLTSQFLEQGRVVSRDGDAPAHQGDSLLWSGLALYALPCADGTQIEDALIAEIEASGGALQRFPGLPKPVSMDGALGLYRGVSDLLTRCPGTAEKWAPTLALHLQYMAQNGGRLGPGGARLEGSFGSLVELLGARLGLGGGPDAAAVGALEAQIAAWAWLVQRAYEYEMLKKPENRDLPAAYRMHLGLLALETIEANGEGVSAGGRDAFCSATAGARLPTTDHYCGRGGLTEWVESFRFDEWEYRHQRAHWEQPDGNGQRTPALDLLVAIKTAYQL